MPNPSRDADIASLDRTSLDRALDGLYQDRDRDGADLRKAICAFVDVAKCTGWTIERIVIDVKKNRGSIAATNHTN